MSRLARVGAITAAVLATAVIVAGLCVLPNLPKPVTIPIAYYSVSADDRVLTVTVGVGRQDTVESADAVETATSVRVVVRATRRPGTYLLDLRFIDIPIQLSSPLGSRTVLGADGNPPSRR